MILENHPDKMINILKKQNVTIKEKNQESVYVDEDMENNYLNEALCKISKSIFFDQKISYCFNDDINKFSRKM